MATMWPAGEQPRVRKPLVGYVMVLVAATLFGVNGSVAKVALSSGLSSLRLTEARCAGACAGLMLFAFVRDRASLRIRRDQVLRLAVFGVCGVALVQLFYFLAIHRLDIGIALLIQYLGPLLVAIYARTFGHERVRRRIWAALALSLTGLALMVELWNGVSLDGLGVAFALISAVIFAGYLLQAEHEVATRDSVSLMAWGFFFATIFWTVAQPWWSFPAGRVARTVSLQGHLASWHLPVWALVLWVVVLGSIVPFSLIVAALRHVSATRVGIAAMLEPVVATIVAWAWLRETLSPVQLAGAAVVLAAILLAQTAR
ncbi:MAG TPA: EamA family transporter [Gaiellaceae bacterium]|jgi:drug/metabolite transporter (DMT)-like permease|nr:EamA family transporter [Gaiellaceae bacterium]